MKNFSPGMMSLPPLAPPPPLPPAPPCWPGMMSLPSPPPPPPPKRLPPPRATTVIDREEDDERDEREGRRECGGGGRDHEFESAAPPRALVPLSEHESTRIVCGIFCCDGEGPRKNPRRVLSKRLYRFFFREQVFVGHSGGAERRRRRLSEFRALFPLLVHIFLSLSLALSYFPSPSPPSLSLSLSLSATLEP